MDTENFFLLPDTTAQKQYEALRAFYVEKLSADEAAKKFNFSTSYFKKLRYNFVKSIKQDHNPFFNINKPGPKKRLQINTLLMISFLLENKIIQSKILK